MAGAVSKEKIAAYQEMFHHAGMKLVMAAPARWHLSVCCGPSRTHAGMGMWPWWILVIPIRVLICTYEATRTIDTCVAVIAGAVGDVLNVDPHVVRGYLHNDQDQVLESEALANVYNVIAVEIMRAINYYTYENQNNTLEKLYVYGGGSHLK